VSVDVARVTTQSQSVRRLLRSLRRSLRGRSASNCSTFWRSSSFDGLGISVEIHINLSYSPSFIDHSAFGKYVLIVSTSGSSMLYLILLIDILRNVDYIYNLRHLQHFVYD